MRGAGGGGVPSRLNGEGSSPASWSESGSGLSEASPSSKGASSTDGLAGKAEHPPWRRIHGSRPGSGAARGDGVDRAEMRKSAAPAGPLVGEPRRTDRGDPAVDWRIRRCSP
ncbi:hypothetical protein ZWY2020_003883 [Hordeum vulgare]|nr:hypothetical protein ZWY2020_003883 [Hordeum vulgare]